MNKDTPIVNTDVTEPRVAKISDSVTNLYNSPLPSTRVGPLYNAFSYPTKISPEAIAVYIATHTEPGETVLDAFAGSGTTGLAALLCDKPTPEMKRMAESLGAKPTWGPRTAHLFEIGTLGSFVSNTMSHPPEPDDFAEAVNEFCKIAEDRLAWLYKAEDEAGNEGFLRHIIWSEVLVCPHCKTEVSLWDASVKTNPLSMANSFNCVGCKQKIAIDACERATESSLDAFGKPQRKRKRVPARVHGRTGKLKWQRPPNQSDLELLSRVSDAKIPESAPDVVLQWGELRRSGYHLGVEKLHHFYTKRNFMAIASLMEIADSFAPTVRDALKLLVLSYNASHSTLMSRVVLKKNQKDFVLTGSQSGVLYISGLPVEKNVIDGVRRKSKTFIDSFRILRGSRSQVSVHNVSSEEMPLDTKSVDYVFTDPPFGDYIPYAELNQINELWLGTRTNRLHEIIVSPSQAKGVPEYGAMMASVFKEISRVLKPNALATVVFHSAHSEIWKALVQAYSNAGLAVEATSILDKIQASFKQTVSTVSVKGDPLLLLSKQQTKARSVRSSSEIASEIVFAGRQDNELDSQRLYSKFVGRCLELGRSVDIDAKKFYALVEAEEKG